MAPVFLLQPGPHPGFLLEFCGPNSLGFLTVLSYMSVTLTTYCLLLPVFTLCK